MQFKRAVRKGAMPILFQLIKVDDGETSSQLVDTWCLAALLKKFEDVFEPLPSGLSPKREMAHTIPLEEGSKPPFRPIYRLSPKELEEAKRLNNTPFVHTCVYFQIDNMCTRVGQLRV
jgi:hypothetical protein